MFPSDVSITEIIRQRFSCRAYQKKQLAPEQAAQMDTYLHSVHSGPLNTPMRFGLIRSTTDDPKALKGLGTYGLIKDPAGFITGITTQGEHHLEDFGYEMEAIILYATSIGLDTCWLGGNFSKSGFSNRVNISENEMIPAVASIGYGLEEIRRRDPLRQKVRSDSRQPWQNLFFQSDFNTPLSEEGAGEYACLLEMVRLSPSGHNYQPWRVLQEGACYHFYLHRTPGYGPGSPMFILMGIADLQRIEIGIAMCHFELTARHFGLKGTWDVDDPQIKSSRPDLEPIYIVTWIGK